MGTNAGGSAKHATYPCASGLSESGSEASYHFTAPATGTAMLTLGGLTADLDLIAVGSVGGGACDPDGACLGAATTVGTGDETLNIPVAAGETYYVIVDSTGATSPFTLALACP
jgi:hypothetical protein